NKDAADRIADYRAGVAAAAPVADYVTVNVSSPNTPGLRDLQSGAPLAPLARRALALFRHATGGAMPLVAVGGIDGGAEAYARIRAGASLVQLYTALVYEGPGLPWRMLRELDALLARDGFASVAEAVGTG
ncbi:MAG: dihydroorotate dehydrogenase (quinone), partial [Sphingomonas sp.]